MHADTLLDKNMERDILSHRQLVRPSILGVHASLEQNHKGGRACLRGVLDGFAASARASSSSACWAFRLAVLDAPRAALHSEQNQSSAHTESHQPATTLALLVPLSCAASAHYRPPALHQRLHRDIHGAWLHYSYDDNGRSNSHICIVLDLKALRRCPEGGALYHMTCKANAACMMSGREGTTDAWQKDGA